MPKSETEWVVIYSYYASNAGKKTFTRDEIWKLYQESNRETDSRARNLSNNIKRAVSSGWLSSISEDTFSILDEGITKAKEIASREKAPKKRAVKPRGKKATKEK